MANNPFYVEPTVGASAAKGLAGIGDILEKRRTEEKALAQKQAGQSAVLEALNSGDPAKMREAVVQYPEMQAQLEAGFGYTNEATKPIAQGAYARVLSDPANAARHLEEGIAEVQRLGGKPTNMMRDLQAFQQDPEAAFKQVELGVAATAPEIHKAYMDSKPKQEQFTLSQGQQRFDAAGNIIASSAPKAEAFTLAPGERRIQGGRIVAEGAPLQQTVIPPQLLTGLPDQVAGKASAAYSAAGGGKDGIAAYGKIVDQAGETERRKASPKLIQQSFPDASNAERIQLQSAMDAAKTTDEGLKNAGTIRGQQRQMKKAKVFQKQAVSLLTSIIENPQLPDVTGSIEGAYDTRLFSDSESGLIADIQESVAILTSDNMDLMSGVLSESDLALLKNLSSGALDRKRPASEVIKRATELRNRLDAAIIQTPEERSGATVDAPPSGRKGGVLNTDASGNKAWVFPDGSFEEVQ